MGDLRDCPECGDTTVNGYCSSCAHEKAHEAVAALKEVLEKHKIIIMPIPDMADPSVVHETAMYVQTVDSPDGFVYILDYFPSPAFYMQPEKGKPVVDICSHCEGSEWFSKHCKVCHGSGKKYYEEFEIVLKDVSD